MASRVVITGIGAITPLGHTVTDTWQNLVAGQSGITRISRFDASALPVQVAAEVKEFEPQRYISAKDVRRMSRASHLALAAAAQAVTDAGLAYPFTGPLAERTGVMLGTAMGGFDKVEQGVKDYGRGLNKVNPFSLPAASPNLSTFHVCVTLNAQGYTNTLSTACAAGTMALGEAAEVIRRDECEVMISGGTEAHINELTVAGFIASRSLSTAFNADPARASRPFDAHRDGFVLGEGAVIFVLERLDRALARGAPIYAEILGSAHSSDTHHILAPDPDSAGALRAMRWALQRAGVQPEQVDYINAHATGTPLGDAAETQAIKSLFGERAYRVPVNSTKSMVGHLFGAAGAIEALACVKSIETGIVHPTINIDTPDPACDLDYVPAQARRHAVNIALSNSFGLGGQNSCLVLGKYSKGLH
ncbi:MAG: 3-oxoacyl-[acyl-carrier-protein] synthase 2 [Anaerolineae bacterium]|nr:3-oxoacyl-[acyl-carrier-protein] synthase 2 [Anaerolineae bacterium]